MINDDVKAGRLRARQLQAIDGIVPAMMVANVVCSGALTFLLYDAQPLVLSAWFALIAALCVARFVRALRSPFSAANAAASRRAIARSICESGFMAACFASVPAWMLTQTTGLAFTIIVCLMTGVLWAGGLTLATVPPAAIVYVGTACAITVAGTLAAGATSYDLFLCFLFIVGALTVLQSVGRQFAMFLANQNQQIDLQRQSDVIGVLLKDYEEQASDWLWETDTDLRYRNVSNRFAQALGRPREAIEGVVFGTLLSGETVAGNEEARSFLRAQAEACLSFSDVVVPFTVGGQGHWWAFSGRPFVDETGEFCGYRGVCTDITPAKRAETRIAHLAHHDPLTDLPNRTLLSARLDHALSQSEGTGLCLLSLDLDGFKAVNDRYGHPAGDKLLIEVAARLRDELGAGDFIARLGGDEFVILHEATTATDEVEELAGRLIASLKAPFRIDEDEASVGVSIGIAFAPTDGQNAEELLKNVDAALYRSKMEGRGTYRFFAVEMDHKLQERRRLVQDLRTALGRGELVLYYQPFVSSDTGAVTGCEALLRWRHPERGMIPPVVFIPLAEESGLIVEIGAWVIQEACREAAAWANGRRVSVNISPAQFGQRDLPQTILAALASSGLSPSRLEVEVTEAVLIGDADAALDVLRQIRALGVRIALDDFGTGYSSLSYLRSFPFDKIKIDKSFVSDLAERVDNQIIVQAIRDIARGLRMTITAEGVETQAQAERLRQTGCEELQGYLYSKPKPAAEISFREGGLAMSLDSLAEVA